MSPETNDRLRGKYCQPRIFELVTDEYQGELTSAPRQLLRRTKFQSLFNDLLLPVLTNHWKYFPNVEPDILVDACEIARLSCERIRSMKKDDAKFWVIFDEFLEMAGIRQPQIDAAD